MLIDRIEESDDLKGIDYDPSFITNLLDNKSFVDVLEDGLVQIKTKYLTTAQKRYVRIIYNAKENVRTVFTIYGKKRIISKSS